MRAVGDRVEAIVHLDGIGGRTGIKVLVITHLPGDNADTFARSDEFRGEDEHGNGWYIRERDIVEGKD